MAPKCPNCGAELQRSTTQEKCTKCDYSKAIKSSAATSGINDRMM